MQKLSQIDQVNLIKLVEQWTKEDPTRKFFVRPCTSENSENKDEPLQEVDEEDDDDGDLDYTPPQKISIEDIRKKAHNFLYIHQEKWQRDLLIKCGNNIFLLDATYKTTKYNLPLFFLCVLTNSGYQIVGERC